MQDIITTKLAEWQHNLEHLQQERAQLAQRLAEVDANILRHQGAIMGAQELLKIAADDEDEAQAGVEVA